MYQVVVSQNAPHPIFPLLYKLQYFWILLVMEAFVHSVWNSMATFYKDTILWVTEITMYVCKFSA